MAFSVNDAGAERESGDGAPFTLDAQRDIPTIEPPNHDAINAVQEGCEAHAHAQAAEYMALDPAEGLQAFMAGETVPTIAEVDEAALGALTSPQTPADAIPDRGPVLGA